MKIKKHKASILAASLIILGMMLTIALTISLVAVKEKKAAMGTGKSTSAFQNADTGVELVLKTINISANAGVIDNNSGGSLTCNGNGNLEDVNGTQITLLDKDGTQIPCSATGRATSEIVSVKSVGKSIDGQDTRAIQAAVAAGLTWNELGTVSGVAGNLQNGWTNYDGGAAYSTAAYAIDGLRGLCYLKGVVKGNSTGGSATSIALLPASCQPTKRSVFPRIGFTTTMIPIRVDITAAGYVFTTTIGDFGATNTGYIPLDGIVFSTQ